MGVLGIGSKPRSSSSDDVFALPFDDYLSLSDEEREAVQLRAYQTHQAWINAELERRGAEGLLVCDGKVLEASPTLGKEAKCFCLRSQVWCIIHSADQRFPTLLETVGHG